MKYLRPICIFIFLLGISNPILSQTFRDTTSLGHTNLSNGSWGTSSGVQIQPHAGWGLYLNSVEFKVIMDLGETYDYGSTPFDINIDSLSVTITYSMLGNTQELSNEVMRLHLDETHPEVHMKLGKLHGAMLFESYSVQLRFGQYQCPTELQDRIRFRIVKTNYIASTPPQSSPSVLLSDPVRLEGKKHLFTWDNNDSGGEPISVEYYNTGHFQFQIMKMANISKDYANDTTNDYRVNVDWSKALDLEINSFDRSLILNLTEGNGYYIWRVRAIGSRPGGITNPSNWGGWSSYGSFTSGATNLAIGGDQNPYLFYFHDDEYTVNWIYQRSFSEGSVEKSGQGIRIGESMSYANGLQQVKQNQAYQETKDTVMVQGIYYDYAGREALQTLMVPAGQNHLQYKTDLAFNQSRQKYSVADFDSTDNYNDPNPFKSDTLSFAYYSDNNTDDYYVPDAEGYPFTRTLFYSGTSKIKESGSPADLHRIKPDSITHTVRKYYTSVADPELIKVFGAEAPDAKLVRKEITLDPNNVASIAYIDHRGQTVATCLSNNPERNPALLALDSSEPDSIAVRVSQGGKYGNIISDSKELYLFDSITHVVFDYQFDASKIQDSCVDFCSSCDYILYRTLYDVDRDSILIEETDTFNASSCESLPTHSDGQTLSLLPGRYLMSRDVYVMNNNPASDELFLNEHLATIEQAYEDTFNLLIGNLQTHIDNNDLPGLYEAIDANGVWEVFDPSVYDDSSLTVTFGQCHQLEIPILLCPSSPCDLQSNDLFQTFLETHLTSSFIDTVPLYTGGYYTINTTDLGQLIVNMLGETPHIYTCDTVWEVWQSIVLNFNDIVQAALEQGYERPSLLNLFLDGVGRHINGVEMNTNNLKSNEYRKMYLSEAWNCDMDCAQAIRYPDFPDIAYSASQVC